MTKELKRALDTIMSPGFGESKERWLVEGNSYGGVEVYRIVKETDKTFTVERPNWQGQTRRMNKPLRFGITSSEAEAKKMAEAYRTAYAAFEVRLRELRQQMTAVSKEQREACLKALGVKEPNHDQP